MDLIPPKQLQPLQIHVNGTARSFAPGRETDDLCRQPHGRCAAGDGMEDDAASADLHAFPHGDIPKDLGTSFHSVWDAVLPDVPNFFF